jgi:(p)ppGpp synthase/HD superfamily hydrolase
MDDVSALLIKLADRLHNMRTISVLSRCKQVRMASETLDVFAVLANRLGAWAIKAELEDLAFQTLNPEEYELVSQAVAARTAAVAAAEAPSGGLAAGMDQLTAALQEAGLEVVDVSGRVKNVYGVWKKIQKQLQGSRGKSSGDIHARSYDEQLQDQDPSSSVDLAGSPPQRLSPAAAAVAGVSSSGSSAERAAAVNAAVAQVYDIQALRVVVPHKHDCYAAMRVVQELWTAMPGRMKDYIRNRKANGYQVGINSDQSVLQNIIT